MTAMLRPRAVSCDTGSSAKLLTLPLDDTRDSPMSARYNGGVDAAVTYAHNVNHFYIYSALLSH